MVDLTRDEIRRLVRATAKDLAEEAEIATRDVLCDLVDRLADLLDELPDE